MTPDKAIQIIKSKFERIDSSIQVPLMKRNKHFTAILREDGIEVDNLHNQKLLPWKAFEETILLLLSKSESDKGVRKGNAMNAKLGEDKLSTKSVEGHLAEKVYDKKEGDSVFRRITPVAAILSWANICESKRGYLLLK